MYRVMGYSFSSLKWAIIFIIFMIIFIFGYHFAIKLSIQNHPEAIKRTVVEHCRYMIGKQAGKAPNDLIISQFQCCSNISIRSMDAAGGVFDPVIIALTVQGGECLPQAGQRLIFKTIDTQLHFVSGLTRLLTGSWTFNHYNTYSELTFRGSF